MRRCADPSSVCGHVWAESSVCNRTVLEILNAEQELLNSRVQLVTARRDSYVAGFTLRAAMGRAKRKISACSVAHYTIRRSTIAVFPIVHPIMVLARIHGSKTSQSRDKLTSPASRQ